MKFPILFAGVALALYPAAPLTAQTLASWDSTVKVTVTAGSLSKSGGCEGCPDAGAQSTSRLTADGYTEFVPGSNQRLIAGLSADLTASTSASTIDYGFSFWPGGAWEIRERGGYRSDGTFASGDRFRVAVESGRVVYRKNGSAVYASTVTPTFPLALDVTLYSLGASLSQASVVLAAAAVPAAMATSSTTAPAAASTYGTGGTPVVAPAGAYAAVTDRQPYPKPSLPMLPGAGATTVDPVFQSVLTRITDGSTRPGYLNRSYRTPSSPHQNTWSARLSYFYVVSSDGTAIPYAFDQAAGSARRISATGSGNGGLTLSFYIEPQFSYVSDSQIYGSYTGSGGSLHTIDQYDFNTSAYTKLLDLDAIVPGLAGTYIGGIGSSAGQTERLMAFFGGSSQDRHHYVVVFDKATPSNRTIVDTFASTVNGAPTATPLNFSLHHVAIDRSGRYVMLYPTAADQASARKAPQSVAWDTVANTFTEMNVAARPYGHDAFGYGVSVNQDCCTASGYDAAQWQFRSLSAPLATRDLIASVLTPKEVYLADHTTWNNAQPDRLVPYISGLYRYGGDPAAWRAWDDEIVAVQTDAAPGASATVWRFAHHRSNIASDLDPTRATFWYMPRPNVSPDGKWVLFTSNWEKTLGPDPTGEPGAGARQDVFLVALKTSDGISGAPPAAAAAAPPPVMPVTIDSAPLPSGRLAVAYSAGLHASGGSGAYRWSVTSGALPAGLRLDSATGAVTGTPTAAGSAAGTIAATDAANAANTTSAAFAISVGSSPVRVTTTSLPSARAGATYSATLSATGGAGRYVWSVTGGALPAGLRLDALTGAISGTPQANGAYSFSAAAADVGDPANTASASWTLDVGPAAISLTIGSLPAGRLTSPYAAALLASGGSGSYRWTLTGALPSGLTFNSVTGLIGGTPAAAGTFPVTATAIDAADATSVASRGYSIVIGTAAVRIATASLPAARERVAYSATQLAAGGSGGFRWSISSGSLPEGLALNASTGAITGTPTAAGFYAIVVAATDAVDATNAATASYPLTIAAAVKVTSPRTLPQATRGAAYVYQVQAANIVGIAKWSLAGGSLPPGMALDPATGVLAGICLPAGTWSFNARIKDASTDDTLTLTVKVK